MKGFSITPRTFVVVHSTGFYFRASGKGISVDLDLPALFSERNGYRKVWRIGRLAVQVLR